MKCPECDTEQPDDTAVCKGCGLNFSMWVAHTGESLKSAAVPQEESAEKPVEEPASPKAEDKSDAQENPPSPQEESSPKTSKGFKWNPAYIGGLTLLIVIVLGFIYLTQRSSKHVPPADITNTIPTAYATPGSTLTPASPLSTVSEQVTGNPVINKTVNTPTPKPTSTPIPSPTAEEPTATPTATSIPPAEALAVSEAFSNPGVATEAPSPVSTPGEAVPSPVTSFPYPSPGPKDPLDSSEGVTLSIPTAIPSPKP